MRRRWRSSPASGVPATARAGPWRPPRDIADFVEAYAALLPAERAEVMRLYVVTTFGATVKPAGVPRALASAAGGGADGLAELTALAVEVAAGRRPLRAAVGADK